MSTAEWNVLGLLLTLSGLLLLFRFGLPRRSQDGTTNRATSAQEHRYDVFGWLGFALLIAGTLCQIWANVRWVT